MSLWSTRDSIEIPERDQYGRESDFIPGLWRYPAVTVDVATSGLSSVIRFGWYPGHGAEVVLSPAEARAIAGALLSAAGYIDPEETA